MEFCYFKLGLAVHQCRLLLLGQEGCWAGEGEFAHADCTSGEWTMEVRVSASKCSFSSYFGLKKLVRVGSQPHSCCIDFCAVLMGAN